MDRNVFYPSIFEISTENIRPSDLELLNSSAGGPVFAFEIGDDGFVIRTDGGRKSAMRDQSELADYRRDKLHRIREAGYSEEFVALYENAWENDCVFLSMDRDNTHVPGFPVFDHDTGEIVDDGYGNQPAATQP